jgi:chemotaxis protein methyltransferase CheR
MMGHEFQLLRRLLKEESGLNLGEDKQEMLEGKLAPLLREFDLPSLSHLALALLRPGARDLRSRVAQAAAVQETYFFRDKAPFQYFTETMLPVLKERRASSRRIRIWCAATASGQEPYSLAIALAEQSRELAGWNVEILATDFAEAALKRARRGVYSQFEVQRGLPVSLLIKHFRKVNSGWEVAPALREMIVFRRHNLLDDCGDLGLFDAIFCRNVLIYFDEATKRSVLARLEGQLAAGGYLVLGAAETTVPASADFMPVPGGCHGVFCFTPEAAAAARDREAARRPKAASPPERSTDLAAGAPGAEAARLPSQPGAPVARALGRPNELERQTADLLEAKARARGVSVAKTCGDLPKSA